MKAAALLMFLTLFAGCQSAKGRQSSQLEHLAAAMTGTFSSAAQASVNPTYFPVQLVMHPIWTDRKDGHWLYVEQALETALDRPYRQRVYHVRTSGAGFASEVYELPGDLARFVGAFRDPAVFAGMGPDDLTPRAGCTIELECADGRTYQGATVGTGCESTRQGASYVTSVVEIRDNQVRSWDRGFDADGNQVWGAIEGPYIFDRR